MAVRSFDAVAVENFYLKRFGWGKNQIESPPNESLNYIIAIPAFKEPNLVDAVRSLNECALPKNGVEVLVLINQSEVANETITLQNDTSYEALQNYLRRNNLNFPVHVLKTYNLPKKHAGVGLARKILMDEAVYRFESIGKKEGIIICFDGDATVSKNYLLDIEMYFEQYPKTKAAGIHFEHPFENLDKTNPQRKAIVEYELHLRYYIDALKWCGHPFSRQTIGSSMMVRNNVYQAYGGMNKRKAGEDFYFLQKIIPDGSFGQITDATVYPSCRASDRVPFGTGKAVGDYLEKVPKEYQTYNFQIFEYLKLFWERVPQFYLLNLNKFKDSLAQDFNLIFLFLDETKQWDKFEEVRNNAASEESFINRFYKWMNAFQALKLIHFLEEYFPKQPVNSQAHQFFEAIGKKLKLDNEGLLYQIREWDKKIPSKKRGLK